MRDVGAGLMESNAMKDELKRLFQRKEIRVAAGLAVVVGSAIAQQQNRPRDAASGEAKPALPQNQQPERYVSRAGQPGPRHDPIPSPARLGYDPVNAAFQTGIQMQRFMNDLNQKGPWQPIR